MRKQIYYLFKVVLPDFLFSMLFLLLFSLINFKVQILDSIYVICFGVIYTFLNYTCIEVLDYFQGKILRKMSYKELMTDNQNKVVKLIILFKLLAFGLMILSLFLTYQIVKAYIVIEKFYILLIIAIIIGILRFILNKTLKFDTILISANQEQVKEKLEKLIEELNQKAQTESNEENVGIDEEKIHQELQKIMKELEEENKNK